jgi:hypothetical protein
VIDFTDLKVASGRKRRQMFSANPRSASYHLGRIVEEFICSPRRAPALTTARYYCTVVNLTRAESDLNRFNRTRSEVGT